MEVNRSLFESSLTGSNNLLILTSHSMKTIVMIRRLLENEFESAIEICGRQKLMTNSLDKATLPMWLKKPWQADKRVTNDLHLMEPLLSGNHMHSNKTYFLFSKIVGFRNDYPSGKVMGTGGLPRGGCVEVSNLRCSDFCTVFMLL